MALPIPSHTPAVRLRVVDDDGEELPPLPPNFGACLGSTSPCPHLRCRHHTAVEVLRNGQLRVSFPGVEAGDLSGVPETCSLKAAASGPHEQEEVARLLGLTTAEFTRQIERSAEASCRVAGGPALLAVLRDYAATSSDAWHAPGADGVPIAELLTDSGGWFVPEEPEERRAREIDAWSDRVVALLRVGFSLAKAWEAASEADPGGADDESDDAEADVEQGAPTLSEGSEDQVEQAPTANESEPSEDVNEHVDDLDEGGEIMNANGTNGAAAREIVNGSPTRPTVAQVAARALEELREHGDATAAELAQRLREDVPTVRAALRLLRRRREAHVAVVAAAKSRWLAGPMPTHAEAETASPAPGPRRPRARAAGEDRALVLKLLRVDPAHLRAVTKLLARLSK